MSIASSGDVTDIAQMVRRDPPTRAELNCEPGEKRCAQVQDLLTNRHIPVEVMGSGNNVILVYDRVVARDCNSRFVDNSQNAHNMNHPALACATVANTIQMVSDKRQFSNPSIMDLPDGSKAVQQQRRYAQPTKQGKPKEGSLLKSIGTSP
jgi:UDP-N-acetylenolpyruvoylglucosamine reductase